MSGKNQQIAQAKYVSFVSYRKTGVAVATPVWIAEFEDGYGFTIESTSGKAKRLKHTSRCTVQQCNIKGRVLAGAKLFEGQAKVVFGDRALLVRDAIAKKYGWTYKMFTIYLWFSQRFGKSAGLPDAAVVLRIIAAQ